MGTYFQKQAAADRLRKLASCARIARRKRALDKYARFNYVPSSPGFETEMFTPVTGGLTGAAAGALAGLGVAHLTKSNRKARAALIGALLGGTAGTAMPIIASDERYEHITDGLKALLYPPAEELSDSDTYCMLYCN